MKLCGNIAIYKGREYKAIRNNGHFILFDKDGIIEVESSEIDKYFSRKCVCDFMNDTFLVGDLRKSTINLIAFDGKNLFNKELLEMGFVKKDKILWTKETSIDNIKNLRFIEEDFFEPSTTVIFERLKKSFYGTSFLSISFPFLYKFNNDWFMASFVWTDNFKRNHLWLQLDFRSGAIINTGEVGELDINDVAKYPCFVGEEKSNKILKHMDYIRFLLNYLKELPEEEYNKYIDLIVKEMSDDESIRNPKNCYS